ncbi:MAG: hypothetical protein KDK30_03150 [Leptospiraceae bacterium]|nr:hypothetical protein [Leptospiraceae bacterium]
MLILSKIIRKNALFCGVFLCLFSVVGTAILAEPTNDPETVEIDFKREAGQTYVLEHYQEKDVGRGSRAVRVKMKTLIDVTVDKFGAEGIQITWTYRRPEILEPQTDEMSPLTASILKMVEGMRFVIQINESGGIQLINIDEVKELSSRAIDRILEDEQFNEFTTQQKEQFRTVIRSMMSEEAISRDALEAFNAMYFLMAQTWPIGTEVPMEASFPTMFGGEVSARGHVIIKSVDGEKGVLNAFTQFNADPDEFEALMRQTFERLGKSLPAEIPELNMSETANYLIDYEEGIVLELEYRRTVEVMNQKREQLWRIRTLRDTSIQEARTE